MDNDKKGYSTPREAAPAPAETRAARERMAKGMPALMAAVFLSFVVVAVLILLVRFLS